VALERDDPIRVLTSGGEGGVALAAHGFVEAVEAADRGDLHQTSVRGGRDASGGRETVEARHVHGSKLRPARAGVSAAIPTRR
jgi:hypothetical protein